MGIYNRVYWKSKQKLSCNVMGIILQPCVTNIVMEIT